MARGWESKSVEEQMEEQQGFPPVAVSRNTTQERRRRELELQRDYILDQRTSNPVRRAALEEALGQIEASLRELV